MRNAAFTFHHTYLIKSAVADSQLFRVLQQQTTLILLVFEKKKAYPNFSLRANPTNLLFIFNDSCTKQRCYGKV
jgi:hypothetical protein